MDWAVGVTTVPERRAALLPRTLASLAKAGWSRSTLFVDGVSHEEAASYRRQFLLDVVSRGPEPIRPVGNWWLALWELYIRNPGLDRFLIVQDDVIFARNVRAYLERLQWPCDGYLNLYCHPANEVWLIGRENRFHRAQPLGGPGGNPLKQKGLGALALAFDRTAVYKLLANRHFAGKVADPLRGWRAIDGGIVEALNQEGWSEMVHRPSLCQHVGEQSTFDHNGSSPGLLDPNTHRWEPGSFSDTFPGEDFDAATLRI
jgi:hypothetical protein